MRQRLLYIASRRPGARATRRDIPQQALRRDTTPAQSSSSSSCRAQQDRAGRQGNLCGLNTVRCLHPPGPIARHRSFLLVSDCRQAPGKHPASQPVSQRQPYHSTLDRSTESVCVCVCLRLCPRQLEPDRVRPSSPSTRPLGTPSCHRRPSLSPVAVTHPPSPHPIRPKKKADRLAVRAVNFRRKPLGKSERLGHCRQRLPILVSRVTSIPRAASSRAALGQWQ